MGVWNCTTCFSFIVLTCRNCARHDIFEPKLHVSFSVVSQKWGSDSRTSNLRFDGIYHFLENLRSSHGFINDEYVFQPSLGRNGNPLWWNVQLSNETNKPWLFVGYIGDYNYYTHAVFWDYHKPWIFLIPFKQPGFTGIPIDETVTPIFPKLPLVPYK